MLSSCEDDDMPVIEPPATDITAIAAGDAQFSTLVAALTKADLVTTLQGAGPFTVFAPNNDAFAKAGITSLDGLDADALRPILTSHVVSGAVRAADVTSGAVPTVNESNDIYLSVNSNGVFINGNIQVTNTDIDASNGVIHIIDNVIVPPSQSLVEIAAGNPDFSELVELVLAADPAVVAALSDASESGLTVFAPTNAAFAELYNVVPKETLLLPESRDLLTSVLLYHVVPGRVFSTDLPNVSGPVATVNGETVTFDLSNGAQVNSVGSEPSNITAANILATNGVVHVIDRVLLPIVVEPAPTDITAIASADAQFSTLVAALAKAELVSTLQGDGPFTVFAPNNDAFAKAGITSLDGLSKEALTPILTTHVLSGEVRAANVTSGAVPTVNANNDIYLSVNSNGVFINGNIQVIATDVDASNGVIHVIDNVIVPPSQSLVEIAAGNDNFSELVELVLAADPAVAAALSDANANGLTVFAPTNAAFTELYNTIPKATLLLPESQALLTSVLLYHVVPGRVFSTDLPNVSGAVATANTETVTFDLSDGAKVDGISSDPSNITATNILATNGVIHVIDRVLLPQL